MTTEAKMRTSRIELTLSSDYVPDWGIAEAIRELIQNAKDEEIIDPNHKMEINYEEESERATIASYGTHLSRESLLFGATTKAEGTGGTLGHFGEGYKLAMLVLIREGYNVKIYNNNEVWTPTIVQSRKFGGVPVLTFIINYRIKNSFRDASKDSVIIAIDKIPEQAWHYEVAPVSLEILSTYCEAPEVLHEYRDSQILLECPGSLYVGDLLVSNDSGFKYGYNLSPREVKLERDRNLFNQTDVELQTSMLWSTVADEEMHRAVELVMDNSVDTNYITGSASTVGNYNSLCDAAYAWFSDTYGDSAAAINTYTAKRRVPKGRRVVTLNYQMVELVQSSQYYKEVFLLPDAPLIEIKEKFESIADEYSMPPFIVDEFNAMCDRIEASL